MSYCRNKNGDLSEPIGRLIYYLAQNLSNFAEKLLNPYGLTLEQLQILKILTKDKGLTQKELGVEANKSPANLTRLLDRLEEKKLLTRKKSQKDRRATLIFLTEKGDCLLDQVAEVFESFSNQFLQGVSQKEQKTMRESFAKMSSNLQKISAPFKSQ